MCLYCKAFGVLESLYMIIFFYSSHLISSMTTESYGSVPKTVSELMDSNYELEYTNDALAISKVC